MNSDDKKDLLASTKELKERAKEIAEQIFTNQRLLWDKVNNGNVMVKK